VAACRSHPHLSHRTQYGALSIPRPVTFFFLFLSNHHYTTSVPPHFAGPSRGFIFPLSHAGKQFHGLPPTYIERSIVRPPQFHHPVFCVFFTSFSSQGTRDAPSNGELRPTSDSWPFPPIQRPRSTLSPFPPPCLEDLSIKTSTASHPLCGSVSEISVHHPPPEVLPFPPPPLETANHGNEP